MLRIKDYLDFLQGKHPEEVLVIEDEVNPATFDVTALLRHLEMAGKYPLVYFPRPLNLKGEVSRFPLITNVFASRERCALAMGVAPDQSKLPLSLAYAAREARRIPVEEVPKENAPVKEKVYSGVYEEKRRGKGNKKGRRN